MKSFIKLTFASIFVVIVSPLLLADRVFLLFTKDGLFVSSSQFLSMMPGKPGSYLRIAFYRYTMTRCAAKCVIGFGTLFSQRDTEIHQNVYIGPQCNIGMCSIGKNSLIASGVHIMSGNRQHNFDDLHTPIQQQGGRYEKIQIGEDSWIGNASLIMANVGNHCIIGAGSVVTQDIPDYCIAVGNPARVVKNRNQQNEQNNTA
jgi:virginiamycin A acetyltransferase